VRNRRHFERIFGTVKSKAPNLNRVIFAKPYFINFTLCLLPEAPQLEEASPSIQQGDNWSDAWVSTLIRTLNVSADYWVITSICMKMQKNSVILDECLKLQPSTQISITFHDLYLLPLLLTIVQKLEHIQSLSLAMDCRAQDCKAGIFRCCNSCRYLDFEGCAYSSVTQCKT